MSTLNDLVTVVRSRLNIQNGIRTITDENIRYELNRSLKELYELVINSGETWNVKRLDFSITNQAVGVNDGYQLPSDFYRLLRVDRWYAKAQAYAYTLERINLRDETIYTNSYYQAYSNYSYSVNTFKYLLEQEHDGYYYLRVYPPANRQGEYRIIYYPQLSDYAPTDNVLIGAASQDWTDYAITDTCIKIANSLETDVTVFVRQKEEIKLRITTAATAQDQQFAQPPPIRTSWWTRGNNGGRGGGIGW